MIQYLQLSLFDVMPDAEVDSLIEQLPCRVAKSRIRSAKPKRIDAERICKRCGHWYGSHDAGCAAERIAAMITQNT
jgi:hypothetical protein